MIRRVLSVVAVAALAMLAFWNQRESPVAADGRGELAAGVVFRADRGNATAPFVGRWDLAFPEAPPTEQALTLQIGVPSGATVIGRITAADGKPEALLEHLAAVLATRLEGAPDVAPVTGLDLTLTLLGANLSAGHGEIGATVIAGAFVAEPAGDWRVYRLTFGEDGPGCFFGINGAERAAVLLPRAVEDGPAILSRFRALLARRPAAS